MNKVKEEIRLRWKITQKIIQAREITIKILKEHPGIIGQMTVAACVAKIGYEIGLLEHEIIRVRLWQPYDPSKETVVPRLSHEELMDVFNKISSEKEQQT